MGPRKAPASLKYRHAPNDATQLNDLERNVVAEAPDAWESCATLVLTERLSIRTCTLSPVSTVATKGHRKSSKIDRSKGLPMTAIRPKINFQQRGPHLKHTNLTASVILQ